MDLTRVIKGVIVTEKSERLKAQDKRTYTLSVAPKATKVDIKKALKKFYDVEITSVCVMNAGPKRRSFGRGHSMEKRHRVKKALITLAPKSKALDITAFKTS